MSPVEPFFGYTQAQKDGISYFLLFYLQFSDGISLSSMSIIKRPSQRVTCKLLPSPLPPPLKVTNFCCPKRGRGGVGVFMSFLRNDFIKLYRKFYEVNKLYEKKTVPHNFTLITLEKNAFLCVYTQRNLFEILLNQTEIRLCLPFSD